MYAIRSYYDLQLGGRDRAVDQPDPLGLGGVDALAGEHQLEGLFAADVANDLGGDP